MSGTEQQDFVGRQIGHYVIERCLGKGGMGAVYLAYDMTLDRPAAVKVLLDSLANQPEILERFQREAKAAARLTHPNIVQVYGVGFDENPPYIAMEYVDGQPLDAVMRQHGPMPWRQALSIVGQVAAALDCAHRNGIVHRDIKPANILVDQQGRVRVTDFGIAKVVQSETHLTATGTFIGTPQYMSPEHCGQGTIGPQSDLFSLGVTAYELLTGRLPFCGDTPASLVFQITREAAEPLSSHVPGVPAAVDCFVTRLLAKDPQVRYQSAQDVLADIKRIQAGENLSAEANTTPLSTPRPALDTPSDLRQRRASLHQVLVAAIIGVAVFGVAGLGWAFFQRPRGEGSSPESSGNFPDSDTPRIDEVFDANDADGNGILAGAEIPRQLRKMAILADSDGDGALSRAEMEQAKDRWTDAIEENEESTPIRRPNLGDGDPVSLMRRYDGDNNQRLEASELPEFMRPRLLEADANADGEVTLEELRASAAASRDRPR